MDEAASGPDRRGASEALRRGQRRLLLLRRQGLVLAMLRKRDAAGPHQQQLLRQRRRGLQLHATVRWCGAAGRRARLPSPAEFVALQAQRQLSRRRRRVLRLKEMKQRELSRQRAQWKARQRLKRGLKHKRREELERKAARRIARALREDAEAEAAGGLGDATIASLVARPIVAPPAGPRGPLQPWAAAPRVPCESASALVQQTLRASQLLPPEDSARTGLYDQMLVVGLPLESLREPVVRLGGTYAPQVVYTFPEGVLAAESVAEFCLPQGVTVTPIDPATGQPQASPGSAPSPLPSGICSRQRAKLAAAALEEAKEVLFVLSGGGADGSETSYGMCLHVRRPYLYSDRVAARADLCYCFVAKRPFLPLHLGVLRELVRLHLFPPTPSASDDYHHHYSPASPKGAMGARPPLLAELEREKQAVLRITRALHRLAVLPVPAPGEEVSFNVFEGVPQALAVPTYFRRPPLPHPVAAAWGAPVAVEDEDEATRLVREWAAPVLLSLLGLERVLMVALGMLTELQVVVVSPEPQILSACVLALATLVRPLVWAGPLIATLPQRHSDYLDSPVPLIVGVEALPRGFQPPKGMILVYPERDAIAFHPSETDLYPQLLGHQVAWLLRSLRGAQRRLRPNRPQKEPQQPKAGNEGGSNNVIFPAPRALSPAYGNATPRAHEPHQRQQHQGQQQPLPPSSSWCGGVLEPEEEARRGELRLCTRPAPLTAEQQRERRRQREPDPRAVEEVVRRLREHVAAVAEAALSIDLVHRPRRAVLDRRRSTIVEEKTLEPEMQAWWQECLGMESGALFMQRFMDTQMYANHRYSDAIRKRDLNVALGADAFSPKYRPLPSSSSQHQNPPHLETVGVDTWSLPPDADQQGQPLQPLQQPAAAEEEAPLPHEGPLTELFTLALTGGTAARSVAEEFSYEALVPLAEAGLLYRPCNGMCAGRCDTEDCTDICLELWHHRLVHLRRREIVRGQRFLALPHSRPYSAPWRPTPAAHRRPRHRQEVPSQYRRRLLRAHGDEVLSRRQRLREKGRNALRFRLLLQIARERQRVERHAGLVILGALRRHHARCQMARVARGVVRLQAVWRGYRRRQEIRAFRLIHRGLRRYIRRFRLQRWRDAAAQALSKHREEEAAAAAAAAALAARGTYVPLSPTGGSPGGSKSPGGAKAAASSPSSSGGGLWQYLKKRREGARSPSPTPATGGSPAGAAPSSGGSGGGGVPVFFPPSPPPSGYDPYAHRPVSPAMSPATAKAASPTAAPAPGTPPPQAAVSPACAGPLSPHSPAGPSATLALRPVSPPAKSQQAVEPAPSPSSPLGMLFFASPASPASQQAPAAPSPAAAGGGGHRPAKHPLLPSPVPSPGTISPPPTMASPAPSPLPPSPAPSPPRPHVRNPLISPGIRASLPVESVPEYGSGGIREEDEEASSLRSRSKTGALAAASPVRSQQQQQQPRRPPTGAGEGSEGPGSDEEDEEEEEGDGGVVGGKADEDAAQGAASARPPRLLAESPPSIGRQLVPSEKGPLPLSALRKGLRVRKLDRNGRPHRRLFRLEDQGSLAYAPRLAWRPLGVAGRAMRAVFQGGKPCTLTLSKAVGGVDSSGKTPRTIMALTHKPPLLRPVPGSDPPRYLVFAINDGDRDVVEFELCVGRGVEAEQVYARLLATLQTLCAQAAPPHSPSTPKP